MQRIRRDIVTSFTSLADNPLQPRRNISNAFLAEFTGLARAKGIGAVGFTALPSQAIFSKKAVLFDQVIVLIMEMDAAKMAQAPSRKTFRMVMQTYYELGDVVNQLVDFLRSHGYAAQAGHPLNGVTLYPLVAQRAGLGWCGTNGLLITPEFGPRQRIGLIYTNIENLPSPADNKHAWIADLCARCQQCVRRCPGQAIYPEPVQKELGIETHIDVEKCFPIFADQHGCSLCIKVCPFSLHPYEHIKRKFLKPPT
jgi:epoxyqueuosine reductase QueG